MNITNNITNSHEEKRPSALPDYLFIGRSREIERGRDRMLYRMFEMIPGLLIWGTFVLFLVLSYFKPTWVSIFILAFAFYWILKVVYLAVHTRSAYNRMRRFEHIHWIQKLKVLRPDEYTANVADWKDVWQVVILPMYKESYEILAATFDALVDTDWPKEKMIVVLAAEEAAGEEAYDVARRIEKEYGQLFFKFLLTSHPPGLEGEIPGKGSNETWALRRTIEEVIDAERIPHDSVLVSSLDSDTVVYPRYFSCLTYHFLTSEKPYRTSYQPIPLFINNIWQAPALSRISAFSATFWHTMNQERPEKHLTFSSHSMTLKALVDIGFWQTNVVSEDSRIFWQCFFRYDGDYRVKSLYYPIAMDANVASSFWRTMINIYKQQRRWAFGAGDVPYVLFGYYKNPNVSFGTMWQYAFPMIEGFYSWATHSLLLFVLGWMPILLGGDDFNATLFSYNMPRVTRILLSVAMIGLVSSAYLSILILPPRPPNYGRWKYVTMVLQWFFIPISLIVFGAFPSIEAQTRLMFSRYLGFWPTEKFRK